MVHVDFDELFVSLPKDGWLKKDEARLLLDAASSTEGPILEVGCFHGRSTVLLASLGRLVISVDPFVGFNTLDMGGQETHKAFLANLEERKIDNVSLVISQIEDWAVQPVGFAYLDGDHTYDGTRNQIKAALDGGVSALCVHDWCDAGDGAEIKRAAEENSRLEFVQVVGEMAHYRTLP